jgi:hypothetical protein
LSVNKKVCINEILSDANIEKIFNCVNLIKLNIFMSKEQFSKFCNKFAIFQKITKLRIYNVIQYLSNKNFRMKGAYGLYQLPNQCIYNNCILIANLSKCKNHSGIDKKCILCKLRLQIINISQVTSLNILNLNTNSYSMLNNLPQNLEYLKLPLIPINKLTNIPINLKELVFHIDKKSNATNTSNDFLYKLTSDLKLPFDCSLLFV